MTSSGADPALPAFSGSLRSLEADRGRWVLVLSAAALLTLGLWGAWLVAARVPIFESALDARIDAGLRVHRIEATASGRVVRLEAVLGAEVERGQLLMELDAAEFRLDIESRMARRDALNALAAATRRRIAASAATAAIAGAARREAAAEAVARRREAQAAAEAAEDDLRRMSRIAQDGLVAERDLVTARALAEGARAAAEASGTEARRVELDQQLEHADRRLLMEELQAEAVRIEGELRQVEAEVRRLRYEIERRQITAPVDGSVAALADVALGSQVQEHAFLATVVPSGGILAVGYVAPAALGRVRPGQRVRIELAGFPWPQYDHVAATVLRVAEEAHEGRLRVEAELSGPAPKGVTLTHGQPLKMEIEVDRVAPAALALRVLGVRFRAGGRS